MEKNITVLECDGIGPEIMRQGIKSLDAVSKLFGHKFYLTYAPLGYQAYLQCGNPYPEETRKLCLNADAVLKGPMGVGPKETKQLNAVGIKLENHALLPLRADLDTYICLRPLVLPRNYSFFSPLKPEVVGDGIDILMMRELVGGSYFGTKTEGVLDGKFVREFANDPGEYTRNQIERFAHSCFKEAQKRGWKIVNVQKPNILATGRFWNAIVEGIEDSDGNLATPGIKHQYLDVPCSSLIVDNVAYQLMVNPRQFNRCVVIGENLQFDILTDQGGGILGSLGLMPSACMNPETGRGYFEPSHGSAPDIAGKNIANPYSMIGSVAYMLEKSFGLNEEARKIWDALTGVFSQGYMTRELVRKFKDAREAAIAGESRAEYDLARLYSAFQMLIPSISREQAKGLILDANSRYDADLETRVISTSRFGDLVCENILNIAA